MAHINHITKTEYISASSQLHCEFLEILWAYHLLKVERMPNYKLLKVLSSSKIFENTHSLSSFLKVHKLPKDFV